MLRRTELLQLRQPSGNIWRSYQFAIAHKADYGKWGPSSNGIRCYSDPLYQIAPNIPLNTGCAASIVANCSTKGRSRRSGMVGMSS